MNTNKDTFKLNGRPSVSTCPASVTTIRRLPVKSDAIASVGYRVTDATLEIEFHSGRVYQYAQVPFHIYEGLMEAPSKGWFVTREIKPFYVCTPLEAS